ncbi:hypothetical protein CA13_60550 [Planctomycetes bacterium CA13]|uniref:Uncharacterized protein n=1 Tax=Novipirellula herctigrandis TaxID=2527986 RepID=A0A5C5ZBP2_9BACT|nr:hypothetical protein CA13_60550 [Planctomycetes bacterium CA13]
MRWNFHPSHGFRFSVIDALAIIACGIATVWGLRELGSIAWLFPFVLAHFFLFCNIFRVPRKPELVWAGCFLFIATVCLIADTHTLYAMVAILPITLAVLAYSIRLPSYHGIFSTPSPAADADSTSAQSNSDEQVV